MRLIPRHLLDAVVSYPFWYREVRWTVYRMSYICMTLNKSFIRVTHERLFWHGVCHGDRWPITSNTEEEKEMKRRGRNGISRIHFKNALVSPCDGPTEIDQPKLEPEIIRNIDGAAISHLIPDLNTVSPNAG